MFSWTPLVMAPTNTILLGTITNGSKKNVLLGTITNGPKIKYFVMDNKDILLGEHYY